MFCSGFCVLFLSPFWFIHIFSFQMVSFHSQNDGSVFWLDSYFSDVSGILSVRNHRREGFCVGGNYTKSVYNQLMEVMERLDSMETEHKKDRREITSLTCEVKGLRKENTRLRQEVSGLQEKTAALEEENHRLEKENLLLRDDNERMKRILGNDSSNSSLPPSKDKPGKAPNTYNSRKPSGKKKGAQPGHPGRGLSKAEVERKIREGAMEHRTKEIGIPGRPYITRYRLDLEVRTIATEIRIYADENGKFQIPDEYKAEVSYGPAVRAMASFLYSEGVAANDRICEFINSISGDVLCLSEGSVYGFCQKFGEACVHICGGIEESLLNAHEICTDATTVKTDGKQSYIRNFSTEKSVLYIGSEKKDLETLAGMRILKQYAGVLTHDHETSLYHFGTGHSECNVHLERYLRKNTEETGNSWSQKLGSFLEGLNHARKERQKQGGDGFTPGELERYHQRYHELIEIGRKQNGQTKGRNAKKEEKTLLNRLEKYRENHLLFLHDFQVHYSNNMSEKDLRICKNRQKMAGGFRTAEGRGMYCRIMSVIGTAKRRGLNIFQSIADILTDTPVIL